jgi:hypothetical protein
MASVTITEILGSDSISGSRVTINSNFLILQNWVNGFETTFGINTSTGVLDLTAASTGRVSALTGRFNTISTPASGTALATISSAGAGTFATITTGSLTSTGSLTVGGSLSVNSSLTQATGVTASFRGNLQVGGVSNAGKFTHGTYSGELYANNWSRSGTSVAAGLPGLTAAFPTSALGGGGVYTTSTQPYVVTGTESVIYSEIGSTGFYMKMADGNGATASTIPSGFRLTIVQTSNTANAVIHTGVTGSTSFYTGFNTDTARGGWSTSGLIFGSTAKPYRSSVTLQWEPRIAGDQATQKGSWILIGGTNLSTTF